MVRRKEKSVGCIQYVYSHRNGKVYASRIKPTLSQILYHIRYWYIVQTMFVLRLSKEEKKERKTMITLIWQTAKRKLKAMLLPRETQQ